MRACVRAPPHARRRLATGFRSLARLQPRLCARAPRDTHFRVHAAAAAAAAAMAPGRARVNNPSARNGETSARRGGAARRKLALPTRAATVCVRARKSLLLRPLTYIRPPALHANRTRPAATKSVITRSTVGHLYARAQVRYRGRVKAPRSLASNEIQLLLLLLLLSLRHLRAPEVLKALTVYVCDKAAKRARAPSIQCAHNK